MKQKITKTTLKTVAYLRVSTLDQDIEKNKTDILHFANQRDLGKVHFVEEVASGRKPWRQRRIAQVLEDLQDGDTIIVSELSRLGRSMLECMEILALATRKGICVYSVKGGWQLDHTIQSKIIALAFSMAAEIERDLISQRTKEALRFKKEQGIKLGRPKGPGKSKLDAFQPEIESLLANGATQKFIAHRYHTTEANLHHWLKKRNLKPSRVS
jgi:DNA invertase Pin-like site-specific DNA recombinase